jgi:hypothetical protein
MLRIFIAYFAEAVTTLLAGFAGVGCVSCRSSRKSAKLTLALVALGPALILSNSVSAGPACKTLQTRCVAKQWGNVGQCQMLYDIAVKEGGVWGSPAARIAAKLPPAGSGNCHPDPN